MSFEWLLILLSPEPAWTDKISTKLRLWPQRLSGELTATVLLLRRCSPLMQHRGSTTQRFAFCLLELGTEWVRVLREGRQRIGRVKERTLAMAAAAKGAPRPKSPPAYPDMCGRHRLQAEVQVMSREIGLLEEELHSVEGLQPASRSCKEVTEYVGTNPDPLVPVNQKKRKRCRIWWWIRVKLCLNFSWLCCACRCSCKFRKPSCCSCNIFRRFCCCCCCCDCCNCQPKCCRCRCSHCCRCCDLTSLFRCCWSSNCCNKPSSCCRPRCPKCSCGCVFSCPSCADCCLCPKCTRPCCVSRCLCP